MFAQVIWPILWVVAQVFASAAIIPEQQLAEILGVTDYQTLSLFNEAYRQFGAATPLEKARLACRLSRIILGPEDNSAQFSPDYSNRTRVNWSDNCWQNASCFISPRNQRAASTIFTIINATRSQFSIRSGGHDFNPSHSSIDSVGILIDTRHLNTISLDQNLETATIGPGADWGSVYKALNGTGVSINGARSPNPGVGGQTLGAGIGWLSSVAGVTAASVIAIDIMLPNGTLIHANGSANSDLLWAIRGGGPNFGLVMSYTFRTLPIDRVWYEARLYNADQNPYLINALVEYQRLANEDSNANIVFSLSENTAKPASFVGFVYLKPSERPAVFNPFFKISYAANLINSTFGTLADLSHNFDSPQYPDVSPQRNFVASLPHGIDNNTYHASYNIFKQLAQKAASIGGDSAYGSQPVGLMAINASKDTPLGLRNALQDWAHVTISWSNSSADAQLYSIVHQMGDAIESVAALNDATLSFRFMNDANGEQNVLGSYGPDNLQKLRDIAEKYDPERVMQRLQHGGWLLVDAF